MKNLNTIILLLFVMPSILFAQTTDTDDYLGKISLHVTMAEQAERLSAALRSKIETKAISIVSRYGVSGKGVSTNFQLNPRLEIYEEKLIEGLQNLYLINAELSFFIKQTNNKTIFATYTTKIQGTGTTKDEALTNAIQNINSNDPGLKTFIEEGKQKIIQFYNSKCSDILKEAERYAGMNNFEHALAILTSVPVEATPCYDNIKNKSIEVFKKYQQKQCESILLAAKSKIAGNQFASGLYELSLIDPSSSCFAEAKSLINSTEQKLDAQAREEWNRQREIMKDKLEVQKLMITSARDVAKAYFNRKPSLAESLLGFLF